MGNTGTRGSRIIKIDNGVIGPIEPRRVSLKRKSAGDYPDMPKVYLDVARNYSSKSLAGPPICDELIALVQHMYTEEEATLVRHIKPISAKSLKVIAKAAHRPIHEVAAILDPLSEEKGVLWRFGEGNNKRYSIMPLVPGTIESVLMGYSMENLTEWHQNFARLFEDLYSQGYAVRYAAFAPPVLRTIPIGQSIASNPVALPSDKLEEVFDRYDSFGVGFCACRNTGNIVGSTCNRSLETCVSMGAKVVDVMVKRGMQRRVEKKEILEIKARAAEEGLVSWFMNVDEKSGRFGNFSCSCCGCCCTVFRFITEYNMPGIIAPPHFIPAFDSGKCSHCGKCALKCPLGAITVDTRGKTLTLNTKRCIGCGQCVLACDTQQAIEMMPAPAYRKTPTSYPLLGASMFPGAVKFGWHYLKNQVLSFR